MAATLAKTSLYSEEDIERALQVMAFCGNNSREAERRLKAAGVPAPSSSCLREWRTGEHAERYQRIREEMTPKVVERVAQEAEDLAVQAVSVERALLERIGEEVPNMDKRDLAGSLRNVSTTKALQVDKVSSPLRGRPAAIVEHRSSGDLETKLRRVLGAMSVDSTAEEIPPAHQLQAEDDKANAHAPTSSDT